MKRESLPTNEKLQKIIPLNKGKGTSKVNPANFHPNSCQQTGREGSTVAATELLGYHQAAEYKPPHLQGKLLNYNRNDSADQIFQATDERLFTTLTTIYESAALDCIRHSILIDKMKLYKFWEETI